MFDECAECILLKAKISEMEERRKRALDSVNAVIRAMGTMETGNLAHRKANIQTALLYQRDTLSGS